jgi:crotonobetainyl-CoA:carnitine CoA-transferase CaiB-like acyl-CoA transferase
LLEDLLVDPHLDDIGFFDAGPGYPADIRRALPQPVIFEGIDAAPDSPPGLLGQDTRNILAECGFDDREIDALIAAGALHAPSGSMGNRAGAAA